MVATRVSSAFQTQYDNLPINMSVCYETVDLPWSRHPGEQQFDGAEAGESTGI